LRIFKGEQFTAPGAKFLLGSDDVGRDVLSRIIAGSRISLEVGIIAVSIGTISGSLLGTVSGYFGGRTDLVIQRLMDSVMAFPMMVLALSIMAILGPDVKNVMIAVGIVITPGTSRVVRGATLSVKEAPYIEAAHAVGAKHLRILAFHILPNVAAPIVVIATMHLGSAIISEASLSFLGFGTPPPAPSWGGMMSGGARFRLEQAPWLMLAPGAAISLTVLGFNLLGDALRDVWDPRLRGSR
jgi:peptide/nickel transport system permease protein